MRPTARGREDVTVLGEGALRQEDAAWPQGEPQGSAGAAAAPRGLAVSLGAEADGGRSDASFQSLCNVYGVFSLPAAPPLSEKLAQGRKFISRMVRGRKH